MHEYDELAIDVCVDCKIVCGSPECPLLQNDEEEENIAEIFFEKSQRVRRLRNDRRHSHTRIPAWVLTIIRLIQDDIIDLDSDSIHQELIDGRLIITWKNEEIFVNQIYLPSKLNRDLFKKKYLKVQFEDYQPIAVDFN
jgi:hypothetical protein